MKDLEIYPNRRYLLFFTGFLVATTLVCDYITFFTHHYRGGRTVGKVISTIISIFALLMAYQLYQKTRSKGPVLVLSTSGFTYHRNGETFHWRWEELRSWHLSREEHTDWLVLLTSNGKEKLNIGWLDHRPPAIESLMKDYKNARQRTEPPPSHL